MDRIERFRADIAQYLKGQALEGFVRAAENMRSEQSQGVLPLETQEGILKALGIHQAIEVISGQIDQIKAELDARGIPYPEEPLESEQSQIGVHEPTVATLGLLFRQQSVIGAVKAYRYTSVEEFSRAYQRSGFMAHIDTPLEEVKQRVANVLAEAQFRTPLEPLPQKIFIDSGLGLGMSVTRDIYNKPIASLGISTGYFHALLRAGFFNLGSVLSASKEELLEARGFSERAYQELRQSLAKRDILALPESG